MGELKCESQGCFLDADAIIEWKDIRGEKFGANLCLTHLKDQTLVFINRKQDFKVHFY